MMRFELPGYVILFAPAEGSRRLLIAFAPLGSRPRAANRAWGMDFAGRLGMSALCVTPRADDWYRGADLHDWLAGDAFRTIVARHEACTFYGVSMGAYAACAFSAAAPGSTVIACSPQSTLDPAIVPWERRYRRFGALDWSGAWADGAASLPAARYALVIHDPFDAADRAHARRLGAQGAVLVRAPFLGHHLASRLAALRLFRPLFELAHRGDAALHDFAALLRARKRDPHYLAAAACAERTPPSTAAAAVAHAAAIAPEDDLVRLAGARVLLRTGDAEGCVRVARAVAEGMAEWQKDAALLLLAEGLQALGRTGEAIAAVQTLLARRPGHGPARRLFGRLRQEPGSPVG